MCRDGKEPDGSRDDRLVKGYSVFHLNLGQQFETDWKNHQLTEKDLQAHPNLHVPTAAGNFSNI